MTKRKSKKSNNKISNNDKKSNDKKSNEIYNYICMGVIIIIIIFFICKEQVNKKDGFAVASSDSTDAKSKINEEINNYKEIYDKILLNNKKILEAEDSMDTEQNYFTFYSRYGDMKDNIGTLKSLGEYINKLIKDFNAKFNTKLPNEIVAEKIIEVEEEVDDLIEAIDTLISDTIEGNKDFISSEPSVNNDSVKFSLNIPAKMHLKENPSVFYVYLKQGTNVIYGPIILISYNQYKLLDINTVATYFSKDNPIKIKIEDIAKELFKKKNNEDEDNEIINQVTTGDSTQIYLYGIDQNDESIIFNEETTNPVRNRTVFRDHVNLVNKIDLELTDQKTKYIDILKKENKYYTKKMDKLKKNFKDLNRFGIYYDTSTFRDVFVKDPIYIKLDAYYKTNLETAALSSNNIKELQTHMDILTDNRKLCDEMFITQNNTLKQLLKKHKNRETAVTKNNFSIGDENIKRILGNNTTFFQDGIVDVGAFSLTID